MAFFEAIAIGATVLGALSGKKASKESKKAGRDNQALARLESAQRKLAMLREFRAVQAEALSQSVASGASIRSSGAQGVASSVSTQLNTNLATFNEQARLGESAAFHEQKAQKYGSYASMFGTAANLSLSIRDLVPKNEPIDYSVLQPIEVTAQRKPLTIITPYRGSKNTNISVFQTYAKPRDGSNN